MRLPATSSFTSTERLLSLPEASVSVVRPTWFSAYSQALATLKELDRIQVVPSPASAPGSRKKRDAYAVETYRSPASRNRIPTNQAATEAPGEQLTVAIQQDQPTTRILRSYDDFVELQKRIYHHVHNAHQTQLCTFCDEVVGELIGGNPTPNAITKLLIGDARLTQRLNRFLNCMVEFSKSCGGDAACLGQNAVPILLHDFVTGSQELAA